MKATAELHDWLLNEVVPELHAHLDLTVPQHRAWDRQFQRRLQGHTGSRRPGRKPSHTDDSSGTRVARIIHSLTITSPSFGVVWGRLRYIAPDLESLLTGVNRVMMRRIAMGDPWYTARHVAHAALSI